MADLTTRLRPPPGLRLVAWGGGVDSTAMLILLHRAALRPQAILMADPGHEWPETYAYRETVMRPWLARVGFPDLVVVTREQELHDRRGGKNYETLGELCARTQSLPSPAYPSAGKKCSFNYKRAPQVWWTEKQAWAQTVWAHGERLVKCIGYDVDELRRVRPGFNDPREDARYVPWYPVIEAGLGREDCEALIRDEGLPVPRKSACVWCPNNTLEDWRTLRTEHPDLFAEALAMEAHAEPMIENPDIVGLMQCHPHGRRSLRVWAEGGYVATMCRAPDQDCACHD